MKSKKKYVFSIIFFVILLVVTYYVIFKNNDINDILFHIKSVSLPYLLIGIGLVIIYIVLQALYIKVSLKSLNKKINIFQGIAYASTEFYFSSITPSSTGGQPAQAYYMSKDNIPLTKSSLVLILGTISYKIVIIFMGIVCMILYPSLIFTNSTLFTIIFIFGMFCNFNMILVCLLLMYSKKWIKRIVTFFIKLGAKFHIIKDMEKTLENFDNHLEEYQDGAKYLSKHLSIVFKVILFTFLQRIAIFSVSYVIYRAFGLNSLSYMELIAAQTAVALCIDALPLPGGIGASEAMLILIYEKIFPPELVTPAMLVTRGLSYYFCLLFSGSIVFINHLRITFKKSEKTKPQKI